MDSVYLEDVSDKPLIQSLDGVPGFLHRSGREIGKVAIRDEEISTAPTQLPVLSYRTGAVLAVHHPSCFHSETTCSPQVLT